MVHLLAKLHQSKDNKNAKISPQCFCKRDTGEPLRCGCSPVVVRGVVVAPPVRITTHCRSFVVDVIFDYKIYNYSYSYMSEPI